MADMTLSVEVDRTSLSLSPLELNDGPRKVVELGPGLITRQRTVVKSPFIDGEFLIASLKQQMEAHLVVRIHGTSASNLKGNSQGLVNAFSQFEYTMTVTMNGEVYEWNCEPADIGPVETQFNKYELYVHKQTYRLAIPRYPVPTEGPF